MSNWTKGAWFIRAERYRFIRVMANDGAICHMDTTDGEGAANAKLISAAPELVDALRSAIDALDRNTSPFPISIEHTFAVLETGRTALAKAGA